MILIGVILLLPFAQAACYSFTDWTGSTAHWVGLLNYRKIFVDPEMNHALINSVLIMLSVPFGMTFAFVTAYLLSLGAGRGRRP